MSNDLVTLEDEPIGPDACFLIGEMVDSFPATNALADPLKRSAYIVAMTEAVQDYPAYAVLAALSPKSGIVTVCKFVPSIVEVLTLIRERMAEKERYTKRLEREQSTALLEPPREPKHVRDAAVHRWLLVKRGIVERTEHEREEMRKSYIKGRQRR